MRCNHCEDAPCVAICPTKALYKREDGIVDFDSDRCIGCKACMNACPYDALYIDPQSQTAAKCNFCAHRLDEGLKPSCEIVCPTQAIISGDLDDPDSEVSRLIDTVPSRVRAPEQGTRPQVFYLGVHDATIDPLAIAEGKEYLSQIPESQREKLRPLKGKGTATTVSDIAHPPPWGWKVSSYFLSKGIAAGAMMLAVLLLVVGAGGSALADIVPGAVALAGIAVTGLFLVWDLKQPTALLLPVHPARSGDPGWRSAPRSSTWRPSSPRCSRSRRSSTLDGLRDALRWAMVPAGAALAGYTALLFNQCEGRDLWQSPLLLPHTIINALLAGAGTLAIAALFFDVSTSVEDTLAWSVGLAAVLSGGIALLDAYGQHPTRQADRAAKNLRRDLYAARFRAGSAAGSARPRSHRGGRPGGRAERDPGRRGRRRARRTVAVRGRLGPGGPERSTELKRPRGEPMGGIERKGARRPTGYGEQDGASSPIRRTSSGTRGRRNDPKAWPKKVQREYMIVPTVCFNCESACGLTAYVDKETFEVAQARGQPAPPGVARPQLRQGPGDHQPDQGSRADPASACGARAPVVAAAGSASAGTTCSTPSPSSSTTRSPPTVPTTSCTSWADPARTASPTASSRRGTATATTRTPTSARPAAAPASGSGRVPIARPRTTPTRSSRC